MFSLCHCEPSEQRAGRHDSVEQSRDRLPVRRCPLGSDWSSEPHHATPCQQLRRGRTEARRHRRGQGLHPQGVEGPVQLSKDQYTQRK